jgi:hypothetical protein
VEEEKALGQNERMRKVDLTDPVKLKEGKPKDFPSLMEIEKENLDAENVDQFLDCTG